MNIFIVGAGFTKAIFPNAPLNKDLLKTLALKSPKSAAPSLRDLHKTDDIEIVLTKLGVEIKVG